MAALDSTADSAVLSCELKVPFPTSREAEIALHTLSVDQEPRKGQVSKKLAVKGTILQVNITAAEARLLRVAVNSFIDHLSLVVQTIDQFGPPKDGNSRHS
ncbi:EKC/KEOPS complex subunit Lage3-like [Glandiceps talaboti]